MCALVPVHVRFVQYSKHDANSPNFDSPCKVPADNNEQKSHKQCNDSTKLILYVRLH
jgi:hypothetical protein